MKLTNKNFPLSLCICSSGLRPSYLLRCLKSIHKYVNDIQITFTYEVDEDKLNKDYICSNKIARRYKATISEYKATFSHFESDGIKHKSVANFADIRNYNFNLATESIILWLDDDDIVPNAKNIPNLLTEWFSNEQVGVLFVWYNYERDPNGTLVSKHIRERIVRKNWFTWKGSIHETLVPNRAYAIAKINEEDLIIEHTELQLNSHYKHERNLAIVKNELLKTEPTPDPRMLMNAGKTLFGLNRYDEAKVYLDRFVKVSGWDEEVYMGYLFLSQIEQRSKRWLDSIAYCLKAIETRPDFQEAFFELGKIYHAMDNYKLCEYWITEGFKKDKSEKHLTVKPRDLDYNPLILLGDVLTKGGKAKEALAVYYKLLEFNPTSEYIVKQLNFLEQLSKVKEAGKAFVTATEFCLQNEELAKAEKIMDALPVEVRDLSIIKKAKYRVKKIANRLHSYEDGTRSISRYANLDVKQDLDTCQKYQLLLEYLSIHPEIKTIIDIGCYNGQMSNDLQKRGYCVTGVDIGEDALNVARSDKTGAEFIHSHYRNLLTKIESKFDLVILFDVLEHTFTPKQLLDTAKQLINPNGSIVINIPDGPWHKGNMDTQIEDLWEHVYSYEYKDLIKLIDGENIFLTRIPSESIISPGQGSIFCSFKPKVFKRTIEIFCGSSAENWCPESVASGIGGSEEAVINISKSLYNLGYKVIVYNQCEGMEGIYDDVIYVHYEDFDYHALHDIVIVWRNGLLIDKELKANKKYLWMHDVPNVGLFTTEVINNYDKIFVLSNYHKSLFSGIVPDDKFFVTRNGVNLEMFFHKDFDKNIKRVVYGSSYDRGLEYLLQIWKDVIKEVPDAELHIYYGWQTFDKLRAGDEVLMQWKQKLVELMKQPNIFEHGRVGHKELALEYLKSGIWAYPTDFPEISCITAMKAQIAGCIPVSTDYAALAETIKYGYIIPGSIKDGNNLSLFKDTLISILKKDNMGLRIKMMQNSDKYYSWDSVAQEWEVLFSDKNN